MADDLREPSPAASPWAAGAAGAARLAPGGLRSLILEKERELHDINEFRIKTLEVNARVSGIHWCL